MGQRKTHCGLSKWISDLGTRHVRTQDNAALNSVRVPQPSASSLTSLR